MNIGIVTVWADCGAGYVSRAYEKVLSQDHTVYIYARGTYASGKGDPFWDHPNVCWDNSQFGITKVNLNQYRKWLRQYQIELVIFNEQRTWDVVLKTRELGIYTAAYVDYYTSRTIPLFQLFDLIICNTRRHYSVFQQFPQAQYIPWGTDCELFTPGVRWSREPRPLIFFHSAGMGGPNDRKGTGILLEAFQRIKGDVQLIVHSQIPLSDLPATWQNWVANDPRIELFFGNLKPPGYYNHGDVYVYPSRLEGIGLTICEAMACGLPVITMDTPPMNEFIQNDVNGTLIGPHEYLGRLDGYYWPETPCHVEDLLSTMQKYVDDPELVKKQRIIARHKAVTDFFWEKHSVELSDLVRKMERVTLLESNMRTIRSLASRLDAENEPTPFQLIKRGIRLYLHILKKKIQMSISSKK